MCHHVNFFLTQFIREITMRRWVEEWYSFEARNEELLRILPCTTYHNLPWIILIHNSDSTDSLFSLLDYPDWGAESSNSASSEESSNSAVIITDGGGLYEVNQLSPADESS